MRDDGPDDDLGGAEPDGERRGEPDASGNDDPGDNQNPAHGEDRDALDDGFAVTSLRPPARTAGSDTSRWRRPLRLATLRLSARGWRLLAAAGALVITLVIILGMIPGVAQGISSFSRATPTPTVSNASSGILTLTLRQGPVEPTPTANPTANPASSSYPPSCPGGVTTMTSASPFTGTLGADPVWFGSFQSVAGQPAAMTLTQLQSAANQYGLPIQVALFIRSDALGPVTLDGIDLNGSRPLWFSFMALANGRNPTPAPQTPATSYSFTPDRPNPGTPVFWYVAYGSLFLPGSGCYSVRARWPGGGWQITFVAGG